MRSCLSTKAITFFASLFFARVLSASPVLVFDTAFFTGLPTDTLPGFSAPLMFVPTVGGEELPVNVNILVGDINPSLTQLATLPSDPNIGITPISMTVEYFVDGSATPTPFTFNGVLDRMGYIGVPGDYEAEDIIGFTDTTFGAADIATFPGTGLVAETEDSVFLGPGIFYARFEPNPFGAPEPHYSVLVGLGFVGLVVLKRLKVFNRAVAKR